MRRWWWRVAGAAAIVLAMQPATACVIHRRAPFTPEPVTAHIEGGVSTYLYDRGDPAGDAAWRFFPGSGGAPMPWAHAALADITVRVSGNLNGRQCRAVLFLRHPRQWQVRGLPVQWMEAYDQPTAAAFGSEIPELQFGGVHSDNSVMVTQLYAYAEPTLADLVKAMWEVPADAVPSELAVAVGVLCGSRADIVGGFTWLPLTYGGRGY